MLRLSAPPSSTGRSPNFVGIFFSRKIERACYEDLAFRVLTGNQQPDHSRISEFRRRNLDALKGLFIQILRLCQKAGMVSLGHEALDGTKIQANASKHKAMSYERMLKAETQLEQEINALMRKAEILDAQEGTRSFIVGTARTNIDPAEPLTAARMPVVSQVEISCDDHSSGRNFRNGLGRYTGRRAGWIS
jgi:hypothetical protein